MADDDAVAAWLDAVARFGFCFVTEVPTTPTATEALIRRIGYVRETNREDYESRRRMLAEFST